MSVAQPDPWGQEKPRLKGIEGGKKSWREDWDFLEQYYLGTLTEKTLDQGKSVRFDVGFLTEVGNMIATKKTPYNNFGEFMRDAGVKLYRIIGEQMNDPDFIARAKMMQTYAEAESRKVVREKNKTLIGSLREELEVAKTPREIQSVLDLANKARDNMKGTQLQELHSVIGQCMGRLDTHGDS